MSNRLKNTTSPYLLQHADNPVDWYSWCDEAFEKAKTEDKPIFLSIGYSTCHWCHVMAHESFEDKKTAEILNKHFVLIKVDREERPDIDSVYMAVCQAFTGSGGWPMSIFMTWDKKPFFAGTYFPVRSKYGMPGFGDLLSIMAAQWKENREVLLDSAEEIIEHLKKAESGKTRGNELKPSEESLEKRDKIGSEESEDFSERNEVDEYLIEKAVESFESSVDTVYGGFGHAPKFPTPHNLLFLTLYAKQNNHSFALKMVEKTLMQMRKGGIFDHIGYGFSRYSTDKYFLAPHFEKMLYDNALLIMAYSAAYNVTKNGVYLETAEKTAEYILREMTSPDGGFYSAQDADSEGVEGKFYTFSLSEIQEVLGEERGRKFAQTFDITEGGNFEGTNIPNLLKSNDLKTNFDDELKKLYEYRKKRTKLHLDDKILVSWNSLMIAAMSILYRVSKKEEYLEAARKAEKFIDEKICWEDRKFVKENLCEGEGKCVENRIWAGEDSCEKKFENGGQCRIPRLYTSYRDGKHSNQGVLDDYAFYTASLIELYNSTLDSSYLEKAEQFCYEAVIRFADKKEGGFYLCEADNNEFFMNPKETYDGAIPSGNSVMAYNFVRLHQLTEKEKYRKLADKQMDFMSGQADKYPAGHSMFLLAKLIDENPPEHVTVAVKAGEDSEKELSGLKSRLPFLGNVIVVEESEKYPLVENRTTYYVCREHACLPGRNEW